MTVSISAPNDIVSQAGNLVGQTLVLTATSPALPVAYMAAGAHSVTYHQDPGAAVVAETADLLIVGGTTGKVTRVQVANTGALASDATNTVTIDVQKSTGGGAFATILSATLTFTNTDTLRTAKVGTISTAGLVTGDILRIIVTVAHTTGTQAQGLVVTVNWQEGL